GFFTSVLPTIATAPKSRTRTQARSHPQRAETTPDPFLSLPLDFLLASKFQEPANPLRRWLGRLFPFFLININKEKEYKCSAAQPRRWSYARTRRFPRAV
ncbi:MAG: hypothetical protein AAGM46_27525, partial [Cyanobacteria bacterium J06582_2]